MYIQDFVPKITAIPVPATCSMDISPSHSDGSLVSMDESMSTSDTVRSPKNMSKQQLYAREMYLWDWNLGIKLSTLINYVLQWACEEGEQEQLPVLVKHEETDKKKKLAIAYASKGYIVVAIDSRYHGHQYDNIS
ncbi:hypothetical protein H5410_032121 [Solanum commersonii]|uniref:Uncharacterized protein n=1 Tax=Solanum commersonii TaxID=4109 RepID=A0A9J5YLY8_SOLCO|nr:hypothetical protein H5410_032121 [Solanum commersonii]